MAVVEYKNYICRTGYGIKKKWDIELCVARITDVSVEDNGKKGRKKRERVWAHFHPEDSNLSKWCCVMYVFKNMGKTDVSTIDIICNYQKDTCIFPCAFVDDYTRSNVLNYSECYDRKIRSGETVSQK